MKSTRVKKFKTVVDARESATREKNLEDRLHNLYALQDRFPDDIETEQEIQELEDELNY